MAKLITLAEGKYEIHGTEDGLELHALRHGEPWRDMVGDNLVYFLVQEVLKYNALVESLTKLVHSLNKDGFQFKSQADELRKSVEVDDPMRPPNPRNHELLNGLSGMDYQAGTLFACANELAALLKKQ